jgi:hypothetical protein
MTEAEQIEIFGLATKVGAYGYIRNAEETPYEWIFSPGEIIAFAKLLKEAEREACAKVCEVFEWGNRETYAAEQCAAAIRARRTSMKIETIKFLKAITAAFDENDAVQFEQVTWEKIHAGIKEAIAELESQEPFEDLATELFVVAQVSPADNGFSETIERIESWLREHFTHPHSQHSITKGGVA